MGTEQLSVGRRVELYKILANGAYMDTSYRDLTQLGFEPIQCVMMSKRITPSGNVELSRYLEAMHVLDLRDRLINNLLNSEPLAEPVSLEDAVRGATQQIADGEDMYAVLADTNLALMRSGIGEMMLPKVFDRRFWDAQDSADTMYTYLMSLERLEIPEGAR